ncbi:hypothetical protein FPQ18DRAFT_302900 [Pyronema domesticum]|nr:hypothetical protein FPQ18DRAFT_302900 [Pyronema domesticum]
MLQCWLGSLIGCSVTKPRVPSLPYDTSLTQLKWNSVVLPTPRRPVPATTRGQAVNASSSSWLAIAPSVEPLFATTVDVTFPASAASPPPRVREVSDRVRHLSATSAERSATSPVSAPPTTEDTREETSATTELDVPRPATLAEDTDTCPVTAPRDRSATTADSSDTCPASAPASRTVFATSASSPVTSWPPALRQRTKSSDLVFFSYALLARFHFLKERPFSMLCDGSQHETAVRLADEALE